MTHTDDSATLLTLANMTMREASGRLVRLTRTICCDSPMPETLARLVALRRQHAATYRAARIASRVYQAEVNAATLLTLVAR